MTHCLDDIFIFLDPIADLSPTVWTSQAGLTMAPTPAPVTLAMSAGPPALVRSEGWFDHVLKLCLEQDVKTSMNVVWDPIGDVPTLVARISPFVWTPLAATTAPHAPQQVWIRQNVSTLWCLFLILRRKEAGKFWGNKESFGLRLVWLSQQYG